MSSTDARTASPSPLTKSSVLADEAALKRVFDSEFDTCLASANAQLGDATALAPRVVESAFVTAWNQRAALGTQEQLKTLLSDEVRHGAARALSRRASAGRFAGGKHATGQHATASAAPADVWAHIEKSIHTTGAEAHAAAAQAGRHDAATHMRTVTKKKSLVVPILIGVVALAVSVGGVMYVDKLGVNDAALAAVSNAGIQPISSSSGQIGSISLGDGTKMKIGPETKVYIADGFGTKNRALKVDGTAQFEVAATTGDKPIPFHVVAKRMHVVANGTNFTVSAYAGDSAIRVSVKEGSVTVQAEKASSTVAAGQAVVAENGAIRAATADEIAESFGWIDGRVVAKDKQLRHVLSSLVRWFNFDVKVPDLPLLDRMASIDVPLDSNKVAIAQIEKSANLKFGFEGQTMVFRDAAKKK
jgi:ferric-dicitrate binding protein FerR (iron transport regulator)